MDNSLTAYATLLSLLSHKAPPAPPSVLPSVHLTVAGHPRSGKTTILRELLQPESSLFFMRDTKGDITDINIV